MLIHVNGLINIQISVSLPTSTHVSAPIITQTGNWSILVPQKSAGWFFLSKSGWKDSCERRIRKTPWELKKHPPAVVPFDKTAIYEHKGQWFRSQAGHHVVVSLSRTGVRNDASSLSLAQKHACLCSKLCTEAGSREVSTAPLHVKETYWAYLY